MTTTEINIACAELDGWVIHYWNDGPGPAIPADEKHIHVYENGQYSWCPNSLPDYCSDGDAIRALVGKQNAQVQYQVVYQLTTTDELDGSKTHDRQIACLLAPADQVAVALLRAHNLYTDENSNK